MSHIREAMSGMPLGDGEALAVACVGSKHHSPTPLLVTMTSVADELIPLCGTCAINLRVFGHLMTTSNGSLSWEIRREFGNRIRALGVKDWEYRSARG